MTQTNRDDMRRWLQQIMDHTGETATSLARLSGLASTTLTRFMRDDDGSILSMRTLSKISQASGVALLQPPSSAAAVSTAINSARSDGQPFRAGRDEAARIDSAVHALIAGRTGVDAWVLTATTLELQGFMPDDILIVNLTAKPRPGQAVCCRVYNWDQAHTDTIFRVYQAPYVIAASRDPATWKPLLIDNDTVVLIGAVEAMIRAI